MLRLESNFWENAVSKRLEGKVALVTGGTSGIGAGTVERLAAEGAKVIFTGSNEAAAQKLCAATGARFEKHNVTDATAWGPLIDRILEEHGRLDIAFANAGIEAGDGSVEDITIEAWNNIMGVNLTGVMLTVQHAMRAMARNPDGPTGSIIVNSSMNAHRAMGNFVAYSVSKSAVLALVKSSAVHAGNQKYKIRVNAVLPGVVETAMIKNLIDKSGDPEATRAAYEGLSPMGRMATVEEIAGLVAWLASDEARFSSGSEFTMDGASTAGMNGV
ncbi:SDR family NAD(P)-dependent oxidoreductase [Novosphingobium sp. PY1]|uniref:SDR family NAD(P)-dependent oxidoreductase n=1 Tax=Novosphingobium sp. PY1 TaxID=1882221 RepID=UPI001A8CF2EE|nr:SDR family NAD(P)-dependent oxidoreductase [Novosphingobium sp. PY1]GFM30572.1 short-chain dehydrogenase/reductase SDR [Novosphingobium sp. PY1]